MAAFGLVASALITGAPLLAVLIVGLVVVSAGARRFPARAVSWARAGLAVMLVRTILGMIWTSSLPWVFYSARDDGGLSASQIGWLTGGVGLVLELIFAAGLAMVVYALVQALRAATSPGPGVSPHTGYVSPITPGASPAEVPVPSGPNPTST